MGPRETRTCRLWSLMWAQICLTASAREDSLTPRKLPRAVEVGIGFIIPRVGFGLAETPASLGLAFAFGFGTALVAAFEEKRAAPPVELEDLVAAMIALETLIKLEDAIALSHKRPQHSLISVP